MVTYSTRKLPSPQILEGAGFFHLRGIAIPKLNDFLFRKRLFATNQASRLQALERMRVQYAKSPEDVMFDANFCSSQRDELLMFGSKEAVQAQLALEADYLPQHQCPPFHERYALAVKLARVLLALPEEGSNSDLVKEKLLELQGTVNNLPKVNGDWFSTTLQEGVQPIGPKFYAPNVEAVENLLTELQAAREEARNGALSHPYYGLRAIALLPPDVGSDKDAVEKEQALLASLAEVKRQRNIVVPSQPLE